MSAKKHILSIAKEKKVSTHEMARVMKYDHVKSFYRAMSNTKTIKLNKISALSKLLDMPICDMITIFNSNK